MPELPELQVLIPYRDLEALLTAARELGDIRRDLKRCYEQLDRCRAIQTETMEKYQELYSML